MIGSLLSIAHVAFQAMTAPIRNRKVARAFAAQRDLSEAKDRLRHAILRKDKRSIHHAEAEVHRARTAQLSAERAMGWRV